MPTGVTYAVGALLVWLASCGLARAQTLPDDVSSLPWMVDGGTAVTVAEIGPTLYLGGVFRAVARRSDLIGPVAVFGGQSAELLVADPALAGAQVNAVVPDGAGGWFVGGLFSVDGQRRQLLRYDAAGRRLPWALDVGGDSAEIHALTRVGSTLYVGGIFSSLGGQARGLAAALDIATATVLPWHPNVTGTGVQAVHASGAEVFLGGVFTAVGGQPRSNLARVDAVTGALSSWAPAIDGFVSDIVSTAATVYVGGFFVAPREHLVALDRQTGMAVGPSLTLTGTAEQPAHVRTLALVGTTLYVGGGFTAIGGVPRHGAAALDIATDTPLPWSPTGPGTVVWSLAATADGVFLGGEIAGPVRRHAIKVDAVTGGRDAAWDPSPGGLVLDLAVDGSRVAAVGSFWTYRSTLVRNLVGIDLTTQAVVAVPEPGPGIVFALATRGTILYVGGAFTSMAGVPRISLAAIETSTGQLTAFAPVPSTDPGLGVIGALSVQGSSLFIGGQFASVSGVARSSLAELDADSGALRAFTPPAVTGHFSNGFSGLAVANGRLWTTGNFTAVGGTARRGFAVFDAATGALDPLDLQAAGGVDDGMRLSLSGDGLYVAGSFIALQGQPRDGVARVNTTTRTLDPWSPPGFIGLGDVAGSGPIVFATGLFAPPPFPIGTLAALDAATGVVLPWAPQPGAAIERVADVGSGVVGLGSAVTYGWPTYYARRPAGGGAPDALADVGVLLQGDRVTVRWTPSPTGALPTSYTLLVGSRPGAADIGIIPMPRNAGVGLNAVVPFGRYFLRIVPQANGIDGPPSPEVAFVVGFGGCATVPTPPLLTVAGPTPVLQWTAGPGSSPTGYELRGGVAPGALTLVRLPLPASTTAFSTAGVPPGVYYAAVVAIGPCGVSAPSNVVQVVVPLPPPPSDLSAQVNGRAVALTWTAAAGATGYVLEAGSASGLANLIPGLLLGPTPGLFAPGVPPGRYFVRLRARYGALTSAPSAEIVVDVP